MKTIFIKNTYDLNLVGQPSKKTIQLKKQNIYGVSPVRLGIKPKLNIKEGDNVRVGTLLFFDKKNHLNKFLSPVSGVVKQIILGPKRVVERIEIESDGQYQSDIIFDPTLNSP